MYFNQILDCGYCYVEPFEMCVLVQVSTRSHYEEYYNIFNHHQK